MLEIITDLTRQKLLYPSWETTKQLLENLEIEFINQVPNIKGIIMRPETNRAIAYVTVKNEPFYIGVHFDTQNQPAIISVDAEPFVLLHYLVSSEEMDNAFLRGLTHLTPTEILRPEDDRYGRPLGYTGLSFTSSDKPGRFDDKMDELLSYLETDADGVKALQQHTGSTDIFVTICFYVGTGNFTHLDISHSLISRLHALGLMLTFDLYVSGNKLN